MDQTLYPNPCRAGHGQRRAALGGAARGAAGAVALPARQAARHRRRRPRRPGGAAAGRLAARALPAEPYPRPPQTLSTNAGTLPHTVQVWPGDPWACSRIDSGAATSQTQLGCRRGEQPAHIAGSTACAPPAPMRARARLLGSAPARAARRRSTACAAPGARPGTRGQRLQGPVCAVHRSAPRACRAAARGVPSYAVMAPEVRRGAEA